MSFTCVRFPVVPSPVDSSQVDSTRSVHPADGSSHGQFNTGRFIPEREKQLAHVPVEDVLDDLGISYCCHNTRAWTGCLLTSSTHTYVVDDYQVAVLTIGLQVSAVPSSIMEQTRICDGRNSSYYQHLRKMANGLQSLLLCNHPSMWTFFDGIMKEIAMQTVSFLQATAGSQRAPKKKYTVSSKNDSNVQLTTMVEQIV